MCCGVEERKVKESGGCCEKEWKGRRGWNTGWEICGGGDARGGGMNQAGRTIIGAREAQRVRYLAVLVRAITTVARWCATGS